MKRLKCLWENFGCRQIKADGDRGVLNRFVSKRSDTTSPDFLVGMMLRFLRVPTFLTGQYCLLLPRFYFLLIWNPLNFSSKKKINAEFQDMVSTLKRFSGEKDEKKFLFFAFLFDTYFFPFSFPLFTSYFLGCPDPRVGVSVCESRTF